VIENSLDTDRAKLNATQVVACLVHPLGMLNASSRRTAMRGAQRELNMTSHTQYAFAYPRRYAHRQLFASYRHAQLAKREAEASNSASWLVDNTPWAKMAFAMSLENSRQRRELMDAVATVIWRESLRAAANDDDESLDIDGLDFDENDAVYEPLRPYDYVD
jgi:hypothetical protein